MISPELSRAGGAPRGAHAQSWFKRIMVLLATVLLAAGLGFAGASTATAAPVLTNSQLAEPRCRGEKPGICPNSSTEQSNQETSRQSHQPDPVPQLNDRSTTRSDGPAANQSPAS